MPMHDSWDSSLSFFRDWPDAPPAAAGTDRVADPESVDAAADGSDRRRKRLGAAVGGVVGAVLVCGLALPMSSASADPSASTWKRLRTCESSNNYRTNTGNAHYGAYQFDLSTWRSVGGHGYPNQASKAEQDARALILYRERGWQPWQCAGILGLREDADAGSGRTSDIRIGGGGRDVLGHPAVPGRVALVHLRRDQPQHQDLPGPHAPARLLPRRHRPVRARTPCAWSSSCSASTGSSPTATSGPTPGAWPGPAATRRPERRAATPRIPAFPGRSHWYAYGETSRNIKTFQDRMHQRGYFPVGTGQYGPNTLRMVKQLQRLNGLVPNGLIGPNTWRLAWTGRYHA